MSQTRVINGPHIRTERTTRSVMMHVSISLIPALLGAIYFFGIRALYLAEGDQKTGDSGRFQCSGHRAFAGAEHAGDGSNLDTCGRRRIQHFSGEADVWRYWK